MKVTRIFNVLMALFLIAAAMANVQPAAAQVTSKPAVDVSTGVPFVPGEVIVSFAGVQKPAAAKAQASALAGEVSAQVVGQSGSDFLFSFAEDADVAALAEQLAASAGVTYAGLNYIASLPDLSPSAKLAATSKPALAKMRSSHPKMSGTPTFPIEQTGLPNAAVPPLWGWDKIDAEIIWSNTSVSPQVCVIDTGADTAHPDLATKVLSGKDFVWNDLIADDENGHGTHVAGIIAAKLSTVKNTTGVYGTAGVSNGTVLAQKALNGQGTGTYFNIGQAIDACALSTARVINMSLGMGTQANEFIYDKLENAIITKDKFVVVAAGNESTSVPTYPGAWAIETICRDGTSGSPCSDPTTPTLVAPIKRVLTATQSVLNTTFTDRNTIYRGMVAVAAGAVSGSTDSDADGLSGGTADGLRWVDTATNPNSEDTAEMLESEMCLTSFSNYGNWVEIVAPGEDIYSTMPVTYSSALTISKDEGSDGVLDGYAYMNGTSMAAPFVAGAVARIIGVFSVAGPLLTDADGNPTPTYIPTNGSTVTIKEYLLEGGTELDPASFVSDPTIVDKTVGYADTGYQGEAPYCMPNNAMGAANSMANAKYLNVAKAMHRTAITVDVRSASNGMPLLGATVEAFQNGTLSKDKATVSAQDNSQVILINLPTDYPPAVAPAVKKYTIKVAKLGYAVAAPIGQIVPTEATGEVNNTYSTNNELTVSVPPIGTLLETVVADWTEPNANLDMYGFLPAAPDATYSGWTNPSIIGSQSALFAHDAGVVLGGLGTGPLAGIINTPDDVASIYKMQYNFNGGNSNGSAPTESISIAMKAAPFPYYNTLTNGNIYAFYLTDYGAGGDGVGGATTGTMHTYSGDVIVRVWRAGAPVPAFEDPDVRGGGSNGVLEPLTTAPFAYTLDTFNCDSQGSDENSGTAALNADNQWLEFATITGSAVTVYKGNNCVVGDDVEDTTVGDDTVGGFIYGARSSRKGSIGTVK